MVVSMERWSGKVAIVTGASVGIGACIAEELVKHGVKVVGIARRVEKIEELSEKLSKEKGKLYALKADISKEDDILNVFKWVKTNLGPLHILINNAGIQCPTTLIGGNTEMWKKTFDVNVIGLCIATREAVEDMKLNKIDGHIIHINSVVGHKVISIPMNVYPATKYAVTALTETLRRELNTIGSKIKITSISPGGVRTEFEETNGFPSDSDFVRMRADAALLNSEDVMDAVIYALSTPPHVQVHELLIKAVNEVE